MKKIIAAALVLCFGGYTLSSSAATTCTSLNSASFPASSSTPISTTGNTCSDTSVVNVCGGTTGLNGSGDQVFTLALGANYSNVQVSVSSTGSAVPACNSGTGCAFQPNVFILKGASPDTTTCGNQACKGSGQGAIGGTATATVTPSSGAGNYFVVVSDTGNANDTTGCGPFSLQISGTLPVKLQKFSVK